MAAGNLIQNFYEAIVDGLYQMKLYKDKNASESKVLVKVMHSDIGRQVTHPGLLTKNREFCIVPTLERPIYKPKIWEEHGKKFIYVGHNSHSNLDQDKIIKVAESEKNKIWLKFKINRQFYETKVFYADGSINWGLLNNNWSVDFASQTNNVIKARLLQVLLEMGNAKFMLSMIASGLFGVCIGFASTLLLT